MLIVPALFIITMVVFLLVRFVPGCVIDLMLAQMKEQSGLDKELTHEYLTSVMGQVKLAVGSWTFIE